MRVLSNIARIFLGLLFLVYGLNGFFRFGHAAPFETAIARQYMDVMLATPYGDVLFALQVLCGIALLCNLFVPLALTILAAYLFNIYMFHLFLDPSRSGSTILATLLWIFTSMRYKGILRGLLRRNGSTVFG
jgi:putative oxidoreductase